MNESKETIVVGDLFADNGYGSQADRIYDGVGIAPTLGASHFCQIKYILENDERRKEDNQGR